MNAAGNHEFNHVMCSMKKCAALDDNCCGAINHAVEESNVKTSKKAQFVWQMKSNYHLKSSNSALQSRESSLSSQSANGTLLIPESMSCNSKTTSLEPVPGLEHSPPPCDHHPPVAQSGSSSDTEAQNPPLSSLQPLPIGSVCDYHSPSAQTGSNSIPEGRYPPLPPLRIGATTVSCVVCDTFNENIRSASLFCDGERPSTLRLPTSHPDWNVRKWQTRQIAKAFMDNTINGVLEEMGFNPTPESAPDSDLDDVLSSINFPRVDDDSMEEEEEDESVENEGILSAIQRHGLQRHTLQSRNYRFTISSPTECSSSANTWRPNQQAVQETHDDDGIDRTGESTSDDEEEAGCSQGSCVSSSCKCTQLRMPKVDCISQPSVCTPSIPDTFVQECNHSSRGDELNTDTVTSLQQECLRLIGNEDESCKKRQGRESLNSTFSKRRCLDSTDEDSKGSCTSSQSTSSPDFEEGIISIASQSGDRNSPTFGHFEFMDAAVAAAIQKKGLSALACQEL